MEISIIIPTYHRNSILYKHLALAHASLAGLDYEIIVVNDAKDNIVEIQSQWSDHMRCISNTAKGVASARNLGAKMAKAVKLIFMDDDMILSREAVEACVLYLDENPHSCLNINWVYPDDLLSKLNASAFGRYLQHFGFTSLKGWQDKGFDWRDNEVIPAVGITSQFLAITKESFIKSGGYNENFPFAGFEDHDFSMRLEQAGIKAYIHTGIMIWHNEEDRVVLSGWLQRKYRGGQTRKVAVDMGHKELVLDYNNAKGSLYKFVMKYESSLQKAISRIPNDKTFDPLYFRMVNFLLGLNTYMGYTKQEKKDV